MEYEMKLKTLSQEDLVNLLSTALYSNSALGADYDRDAFKHLYKKEDCFEEKLAKILLGGGHIVLIDFNSYETVDDNDDDTNGTKGINWVSTELYEVGNAFDDYYCIGYTVTLETIIKGANNNPKAIALLKELIEDEEGDLYTAYNAIQCIVFGEEIYG